MRMYKGHWYDYGGRRTFARHSDVVYLMIDANNRLKIGKTGDLTHRFKCLKQKHKGLRILATINGYTCLEADLHRLFADHRIYTEYSYTMYPNKVVRARKATDWYNNHPSILEWFQKYAAPYSQSVQDVSELFYLEFVEETA